MRGYAKVCDDAVDAGTVSLIYEEIMNESEIVVYECKAAVIGPVGQCVCVPVECDEPSLGRQPRKNGCRMSASAESGVCIDPGRVGDDGGNAFFKQNRCVIVGHIAPPGL